MDVSESGEITSVVVSRGGDVAVEEYFDGDAETLRNTRSCTKTVAGMLLGIALERGIVAGVDASLENLLGEPAPPVTLRDLLTMSSCLECNDWDEDSPGNEELMYPQENWLGFVLGLPLRDERTFSYCTAGVVALGIGLERAVGEPLWSSHSGSCSIRSESIGRLAAHTLGTDVQRGWPPAEEPRTALARRAVLARWRRTRLAYMGG